MEITVNEQVQRFHLAFEKEGEPNWQQAGGHEICVGPYRFCAIPLSDRINISEVTTGFKVWEINLNTVTMAMTETKEDTLAFFKDIIGQGLKRKIEGVKNFDEHLAVMQKKTFERFGEMPRIENVDLDA
ncbi:hypothetical protein MKY34_11190 [Sporosarcina sp. FSL K6-1522]|uniref:hypothetical protein n=1 Tax=Sporosarcina sp. FSL K6-1522 TaxID=2921554 RepID=UPI0031599C1B